MTEYDEQGRELIEIKISDDMHAMYRALEIKRLHPNVWDAILKFHAALDRDDLFYQVEDDLNHFVFNKLWVAIQNGDDK